LLRLPGVSQIGRSLLLLSTLVAGGCGRVGLELLPADTGVEEDAGTVDMDGGAADAGDDMDGSLLDAGSALVDGCVLSETGDCLACIGGDAYVPTTSCGIGYCATSGSPSMCIDGIELACVTGGPRALTDSTCDGVDDDCNGIADEEYLPTPNNCGSGVCARSGTLTCMAGGTHDTCVPGKPTTSLDDATGTGNGLDDDCDGQIDEDVSSCSNTKPIAYVAGVYPNIAVPSGCGSANVQLWGGAGAAGNENGFGASVEPGGRGGSGGYARGTLLLTGPLTLYVGNGGNPNANINVPDCGGANGAGGSNPGSASYSGGRGGSGNGMSGGDGMVAGGGSGASNTFGDSGGRGHFGGGGGGESSADAVMGLVSSGGGGGGAATVALLNGMRVLVAGGGGGGGGAATLVYNFGEAGGNGGEGCSGSGTAGTSPRTGGGGGGGVCVGMTTSAGTNGLPANADLVPPPLARGTNMKCTPGGNGYAIVTFAR
jgi:hypothetical protein